MTELVCPVCGHDIEPGANVCNRCGFRLAGMTEEFAPVQAEGDAAGSSASTGSGNVVYSLYVVKGPQTDEEFYLDAHRTTLGRDPHCDIFLNDMTVSREHAIITVDGGKISIQDDDSLNGTWVDGEVVTSAELHAGSLVQIGTFNMVVHQHEDPEVNG